MWFGMTEVRLDDSGSIIVRPNGCEVPGAPEDTAAYRRTAATHGYGNDTLTLCKEHELTHVALSHWLGIGESPVVVAVSEQAEGSIYLLNLEEAAVLAIQRFARALGVNLVARWSV